MGIRKLIYVPDENVWVDIQASAKNSGKSVSGYLIGLHVLNKDLGLKPEEVTSIPRHTVPFKREMRQQPRFKDRL